jgi:hypothetical protein
MAKYHIKVGRLALTLFLILAAGQAWGATYYAASGGSGSTCSEVSPCLFGVAIRDKATTNGDVVYLRAGTHNTFDSGTYWRFNIAAGGTVTVKPYPGETAVIETPGTAATYVFLVANAALAVFDGTGGTLILQDNIGAPAIPIARSFEANHNLKFMNMTIDWREAGNISTFSPYAVTSAGGSIEIIDCTFKNAGTVNYGLVALGNGATYPFALTITGTTFDQVGAILISVGDRPVNFIFENNIIESWNGTSSTNFRNVAVAGNNFRVRYNTFKMDAAARGVLTYSDASAQDAVANPANYVEEYNVFYCSACEPLNQETGGEIINAFHYLGSGATGYYAPISNTNYYLDPTSPEAATVLSGSKPVRSPLGGVVGFGDSIMYGTAATSSANKWYSKFTALSGVAITVDDFTVMSGLRVPGSYFQIDRAMMQHSPQTVFVSIGINNLLGPYPANITAAQAAVAIEGLLQKIKNWGATPIWLGCESRTGNPPDNTIVTDTNTAVGVWCAANGVRYDSILARMVFDADWKTKYYADLTTNVHPDDDGHLLIGSLAENLYFNRKPYWVSAANIDSLQAGTYQHPLTKVQADAIEALNGERAREKGKWIFDGDDQIPKYYRIP